MTDVGKLFGRGIAFPPRLGSDGRWAWSEGAANVRESIRLILLTGLRERLLLPQFGTGLERFLFRPNVAATHRLIQEATAQALGRWEPRIRVESVTVEPDAEDLKAARISVHYKLIANQAREQLNVRVQLEG